MQIQKIIHIFFFTCTVFSVSYLVHIKTWLNIQTTTIDLQQLLKWVKNSRRSKFRKDLILASVTVLVYFIWQARNKVYWEACVRSIQNTGKEAKGIVKTRLLAVMP